MIKNEQEKNRMDMQQRKLRQTKNNKQQQKRLKKKKNNQQLQHRMNHRQVLRHQKRPIHWKSKMFELATVPKRNLEKM